MMASPNQGMKVQPQAGLAALAQPAQAPRGMPQKGIQQIMESARKMSDAQLADVLSGKSMDVPQYVAMTEAMGRKSLRNAVQGQQAMAQAKQPSLKDKFLSEEAQKQMAMQMAQAPQMGGQGLAGLPAPNMDSMDMAGGGIIAFDEGGNIEEDPLAYLSGLDSASLSADEERVSQLKAQRKTTQDKERFEFLKQSAPEVAAAMAKKDPSLVTPVAATPVAATPKAGKSVQFDPTAGGTYNPPSAVPKPPVTGVGTAPGAQPFAIPSYESLQGKRSEDYLKKLEGLTEKQRAGLDQIKKQGGGEALMQMAAGILSRPTLGQGIAAGLPLVASTSAATRKEQRMQEQMANDYDLNLAKAREAAEKGDMALALQYQQVANQAKSQGDTAAYQQGMLGVYGQRNAMMKDQYDAVKIPGQLGKLYADATKEVKDKYGGMIPPSKQKQYAADIEAAYRKRATAVGLGKYLDTYSPGATNSNFNLVQSLPKGAKIVDPFAPD
jgi:hypothetical protein